MELTIEQALQQGVAAHKEGKLQDAERIYRAILQSQPGHPDANHNLGVIAVFVNKADAALPLFEAALEANPKVEQFWLSYIDALIKEKHFDNAKKILEKAKKQGVDGEKLIELEKRLTSSSLVRDSNLALPRESLPPSLKREKLSKKKKQKKAARHKSKVKKPSDRQLADLVALYQSGRFNDAEKLATTISHDFPKHQLAWKVLGAVLAAKGNASQALNANQSAVALAPQDASAHSNLGNTLKDLGRLEDAEGSYKEAIALSPTFAEAHINLGATLQEMGRLEEAEASLRQAIALTPDYAEAHSNLGVTLQEMGRLEEAEASLRQAIALTPDYAEAHSNLGATLQEMGRLEEAEASLRQAIALTPDCADAHNNLGITLQEVERLAEAEISYQQAITLRPDFAEAHGNLGELLKSLGRFSEAEASFHRAMALNPEDTEVRCNRLLCLFAQDKKSILLDELDHAISHGKANAVIGSLTSRSALKFGVEKPNLFCTKPLNYVLHIDLNAQYDFEEVFVKKAKTILNDNRISRKRQTLLKNGCQTSGNIFDIKRDLTNEIQKAIRSEINRYRLSFKNSEEGFLRAWPTEYDLNGWLISMTSGGELQPHIHEWGWLSGSIYINVPPKSDMDSGNLLVSLGKEEDAVAPRMNSKKIINVATGSMVLFPASLTHQTIPFEAEQERIVLAFDVVPK